MASTAAAIDEAANPKSVEESLWWDSFVDLFDELENASLSTDLDPSLVNKLQSNHAWFLDTVSLFKPPNQKSRAALDCKKFNVGPHKVTVEPELKDIALQVSSSVGLDEVQSYILVKRFVEHDNVAEDSNNPEFIHLIILQYYIERQCLLKCTRQIFMHALYSGIGSKRNDAVTDEASKLISDGLDKKLLSVFRDLLFLKPPEHMEIDLATLWAEEIMLEDSMILDILFLAYYESFCTCNGGQWKSLCSLYKEIISDSSPLGRLAISLEARCSFYHSKVQLLLILVETLDLENLLQMVHDEVPFRQGHSVFTLTDIQEMDAIISSFSVDPEAAPLVLAWAIFLSLISSLPEKQDHYVFTEIDHVGYIRDAFKAAPLSYILEILENDILNDVDGPIAGYRSVLRTFISAFVASYEVTLQQEDGSHNLILDILCKIYCGEESLCVQFWDKDSFIDGPIRCLLSSLESEFPLRVVEFVRFLSAVCEGAWPAECAYGFMDRAVGISSLIEVSGDILVENITNMIETTQALQVPGVEDLLIPSHSRGHVLKITDENTALVRWEYSLSGVFVLLVRLARQFYSNNHEETIVILDLLCRLVSFNTAVCFALMDLDNSLSVQTARTNGHIEKSMRVNVVEIISHLVRNLSPNITCAKVMSMCVRILAKMLKCAPSHVTAIALKKNIFDVGIQTTNFDIRRNEGGMWLLSGGLARMLLIDCETTEDCCSLTLSVLDFTMELLDAGAEDDSTVALVVFSLQYILVNHEYWKYKIVHVRWNVTMKVLEVMKKCIALIPISKKLGSFIKDILLCDSSVHYTLCRIMCITTQTLQRLYLSRNYDLKEIQGLQVAVSSALDIVFTMFTAFMKDTFSSLPVFHQVMLSSTTKPIPVVTAVISLISYSRDPAIQVGAAKVLSMLCIVAQSSQPYLFGNVFLASDDIQITTLRDSIYDILRDGTPRDDELFVATVRLLISAACNQPAFFVSIVSTKENMEALLNKKDQSVGPLKSNKVSLMDALLHYVNRSEELIESHPRLLLNFLNLLKVLWQGATHYVQILELFKTSEMFWKRLSSILTIVTTKSPQAPDNMMTGEESLHLAYQYQCHAAVLEIMARDIFLETKLQVGSTVTPASDLSKEWVQNKVASDTSKAAIGTDLKNILLTWCESSVLRNLIKSYASSGYNEEVFNQAKIGSSLFLVHTLGKLLIDDAGSLSLSLIRKIMDISKKITTQPGFSELLVQYSERGYSKGKELNDLILSDLYYHMQGELEGRKMNSGPFKDLTQFLLELNFYQTNEHKHNDFLDCANEVYVFDVVHLLDDLGLDFWDHSQWKKSKPIAEQMLLLMQESNSMSFLSDSKFSALKSLTTMLIVSLGNSAETKNALIGGRISQSLIVSYIDDVCKCIQRTVESLFPTIDLSEDIIKFLGAQAELLLCLIKFFCASFSERADKHLSLRVCILTLKTSGAFLRVICSIRPAMIQLKRAVKLNLLLLLMSVELCPSSSSIEEKPDKESAEAFAEVSLASLGLLPLLCSYTETAEYLTLSLATMDLILKRFLASNSWLPVIEKHLHLRLVIEKLREKDFFVSVPIILKFLLTLAQVRRGAEMLQSASFFSLLKVMFDLLLDDKAFLNVQEETGLPISTNKDEKSQHIKGLGLTVITAMLYSLQDSTSSVDIVDTVILYFSEKAYLIFDQLNLPDFPSDDHNKKRARTQKTQTSLTAMKETEHSLLLICVLAKHQNSWARAMKEMDSQLRERSIHLLAYISRGSQSIGQTPGRAMPLLCPPFFKEEIELNNKPSFANCKRGWFSLTPLGGMSKTNVSAVSSTALVPMIKNQQASTTDSVPQTHFSDATAIQIYRIAYLLLNFLSVQAREATRRAQEVGFIDLAHFPELPMPEILHGLQDQAIAIVTELCSASKSKQMQPEIQDLCLLMFQIMEKTLYLEFCVSQACGIRPVMGRVEDFSKEIKTLIQVTEQQAFLQASLKSLKQIISFVYPGLCQTEGFL